MKKSDNSTDATHYYATSLASGNSPNVHNYRTFQMDLGDVKPGDVITYRMVSSTSGGSPLAGANQYLYCKNFEAYSTTPIKQSTGNVGIGTTSPIARLHVEGDIGQQGTTTVTVNSGVADSGVNIITGVHGSYNRGAGRLRVMGMENSLNVGYAEYFYVYSDNASGTYYVSIKLIDEIRVNNTYAQPRLYLYNSSSHNNNATNRQNTNQTANSTNTNIGQIGITNVANAYGTFQIVAEPMHWKP
jgi:hypothetical protein